MKINAEQEKAKQLIVNAFANESTMVAARAEIIQMVINRLSYSPNNKAYLVQLLDLNAMYPVPDKLKMRDLTPGEVEQITSSEKVYGQEAYKKDILS